MHACDISRGMGVKKFSNSNSIEVTFKVIQGHWQWYHSIGLKYDFLLVFDCKYVSILHPFRNISTYFPKVRGHVTMKTHPFRG